MSSKLSSRMCGQSREKICNYKRNAGWGVERAGRLAAESSCCSRSALKKDESWRRSRESATARWPLTLSAVSKPGKLA